MFSTGKDCFTKASLCGGITLRYETKNETTNGGQGVLS
jgi:hypothetical protein